MTTLLTFRDTIKAFYSRYDYIMTPILKGIMTFIIFFSLNNMQFGYMPVLGKMSILFLLAVVCAFLPTEITAGIGGIMIVLQSMNVSLDIAVASLAFVLIFYSGYMRFVSKTGIIVLLVPVCYICHLTYALPIILGFLVGPSAIVPAVFGVILYYYEGALKELANVLATATEEETTQGFQYILNGLLENKYMLLTMVVFACTILVTYVVYRSSFEYAWVVSFFVGGFLNIVLFLIGSVTLSINVEIGQIFIGSIVGIFLAAIVQFCKGVVDYSGTELLQFEDNDYYYYVKAIPKLSVSEANINVKHINSKTHN